MTPPDCRDATKPRIVTIRDLYRQYISDRPLHSMGKMQHHAELTSWLLCLKYLDGLEQDKSVEGKLGGKAYTFILDEPYRCESWAVRKTADGKLDHNKALIKLTRVSNRISNVRLDPL